jgi:transcriptional regulator with XRE-family HTH domain
MSDISHIDGQSVRLKRETMGWAMTDLATLACLSVKQIKQIEEGGTSAFYSENVKLTAARKVAALLQMSEDQLFGQVPPVIAQSTPASDAPFEPLENASLAGVLTAPDATPQTALAPLMRSETLHFLAQPPEDLEVTQAASEQEVVAIPQEQPVQPAAVQAELTPAVESTDNQSSASEADNATPSSGSNYVLKIAVLFILAIAVAAWMRPKVEDDKADTANQESASPVPAPIMPVPGAANDNPTGGATAETQPAAPNTANAAANSAPVANSPVLPAAATSEKPAAEKPTPAVTASPTAGEAATSSNGK